MSEKIRNAAKAAGFMLGDSQAKTVIRYTSTIEGDDIQKVLSDAKSFVDVLVQKGFTNINGHISTLNGLGSVKRPRYYFSITYGQ